VATRGQVPLRRSSWESPKFERHNWRGSANTTTTTHHTPQEPLTMFGCAVSSVGRLSTTSSLVAGGGRRLSPSLSLRHLRALHVRDMQRAAWLRSPYATTRVFRPASSLCAPSVGRSRAKRTGVFVCLFFEEWLALSCVDVFFLFLVTFFAQ
jgi:hypothetical protein